MLLKVVVRAATLLVFDGHLGIYVTDLVTNARVPVLKCRSLELVATWLQLRLECSGWEVRHGEPEDGSVHPIIPITMAKQCQAIVLTSPFRWAL